jgi:hypothetical protein
MIKSKFIILISIFFFLSCEKEKSDNVFEKAIELTKSNEVIKDSLRSFKTRGINFVVCFMHTNDKNDILSFNLVHEPKKKFYTLNVDSDFKIETITGVDVLYINFDDTIRRIPKKIDKKTKELLDKKIITFNGVNRFIDCDFVEFVFCKKDRNNFTYFNNRMESEEQIKLQKNSKPYFRESFYPKCE